MARLFPLLLILVSLLAAPALAAQDTQPPASAHPDCGRIESLMLLAAQTGSRPDQIIQGGGTIADSSPVQAAITA
ncbi:MAG TPA: hypothetical protein VKY59_17035, partial [Spirillospora sp.]|nr:hypothetical protein [Spirillospora sp.]